MTEDMPHILVVDDDTRLRDALRRYLGQNGFLVTTAADAADARAKLDALSFDLMILDVMMPGESGLDLTRGLKGRIPILLLTARGDPDDRIAGLEAGADDYLAKPFEPRELVLRLQSILRRLPKAPPPSTEIRLGRWIFDSQREELRPGPDGGGDTVRLTTAEAALLKVLAASPGIVFSREELVERAGVDGNNARTIDVQVTRLRRKLEEDPRLPRYLQTVRGEGYVLRPD